MTTQRLVDLLKRSYAGEAWHGPCLADVIGGVSASQAAAHPIEGSHSIAEIVNHLEVWHRMAANTLSGGEYVSLEGDADWPPLHEPWEKTAGALEHSHEELLETVKAFPPERFDERLPNRDFTYGFLIEGVIQHNAYHAGQIALLRKPHRRA